MKHFLRELGAAVMLLFALNINAQTGECYWGGNCLPGDPSVQCYLDNQDCYPNPDCNAPGCPGVECAQLYLCFEYDEPCGNLTCTGCAACASGNCAPGTHVAMSLFPSILSVLLPDSLKDLHEKAYRFHGFRGSKMAACRRPTRTFRVRKYNA